MLISFSGLDGSGKTTHINLTTEYLEKQGRDVRVLRMYDNVSVAAWLRKSLRRVVGKRVSGKPTVSRPAKGYRKDKNRKETWIVTMRQLVYVLDLLVFVVIKTYHETLRRRTVICDRHLIDSIVNLSNTNRIAEAYARLLLSIMPVPDVPILIDLDAEVAFNRKPEYPLAYNIERRVAYLEVFRKLKGAVIIESTTIPEVQRKIEEWIDVLTGKNRSIDGLGRCINQ